VNGVIGSVLLSLYGLLFVAVGWSKLLRRRSLERALRGYRLLPNGAIVAAARVVSGAELALGAALVASAAATAVRAAALGCALGLLGGFSLAVASALARGLAVPCGCGVLLADHAISYRTLVRNVSLAGGLAVAAVLVGW
jgi:hypothetical protein